MRASAKRNWWWCVVSGRAEHQTETSGGRGHRRVRVVMPEDIGPMLVEGPVEIVLADGSVHVSERPTVALCTCRRSRSFPFCDTSHRRRSRPATSSGDSQASTSTG